MRHIFCCNVRFSLLFRYYCCQSILDLLTPDFSAEIVSFDRHSELINLFTPMCYGREQLFSLRRENLKPIRSVRKSIFSNRLWLPASARNAWRTESHVTGGLKLSTPVPDLDLLPQGIPDMTSSAAPVITKHQQKQSGSSIKFGLLNAQSVGNKFTTIHGEIVDRNIEACLLTETWHSTGNDTALRRCIPAGYNLHEVARASEGFGQNYGGVAAIVSSSLKYRAIRSTVSPTTFESMAFTLSSGHSTVAILLLYRPGSEKVTNNIFRELSTHLEAMVPYKCQLDLNINVGDPHGENTSRLLDLLTSFECIQWVTGMTQVSGGTLDHVITRSYDSISDLCVDPPGIIHENNTANQLMITVHSVSRSKRTNMSWRNADQQ